MEAPLTENKVMFDAGVGTDALEPIIDMELALGAGVNTGAALAASIRLVVFLTEVLAVAFAFALNKVGTGGGWTTAVAGVTVTQVPLNVPVVPGPTSALGLTETAAGLTFRLETENLFERQ